MAGQRVQCVASKVNGVEFPVADTCRVVSQTYRVKCVPLPPDEEMCDKSSKCLTLGDCYASPQAWIEASAHEFLEALDHEAELALPHWKMTLLAHGITDYVDWLVGLGPPRDR